MGQYFLWGKASKKKPSPFKTRSSTKPNWIKTLSFPFFTFLLTQASYLMSLLIVNVEKKQKKDFHFLKRIYLNTREIRRNMDLLWIQIPN